MLFALDQELALALLGQVPGNRSGLVVGIVSGMDAHTDAVLAGCHSYPIRLVALDSFEHHHPLFYDPSDRLIIGQLVVNPNEDLGLLKVVFNAQAQGSGATRRLDLVSGRRCNYRVDIGTVGND